MMTKKKIASIIILCGLTLNFVLPQKKAHAEQFIAEPVAVIEHDFPFGAPSFSADHELVIAEGYGLSARAIKHYKIQDGSLVDREIIETYSTQPFIVNDAGQVLFAETGKIKITSQLQANAPLTIHSIDVPDKFVFSPVIASPAGNYFALWDMLGGEIFIQKNEASNSGNTNQTILPEEILKGKKRPSYLLDLTPLAISDQGILFLAQEEDLLAYDTNSNTVLWRLAGMKPPYDLSYYSRLSRDSRHLVTAFKAANETVFKVLLIDVQAGEVIDQYEINKLIDMDLSSDGQRVLLSTESGRVDIWSPADGEQNQSIQVKGKVKFGRISPDSSKIAITTEKNSRYRTFIYSTEAQDLTEQAKTPSFTPQKLVVQTGHTSQISDMALSADGTMLATADSQGLVWLWNAENGRAIRTLNLTQQQREQVDIRSITFNPNREELLILSSAGTFVWALDDKPARLIQGSGWASWGDRTVILPDGDNFVSLDSTTDTSLIFNDISGTKKPRFAKLDDDAHFSAKAAISSDGEYAAYVMEDETTVVLIRVPSGEVVTRFPGGDDEITALAFGNGNTLLAAATTSAIKVFNIKTGKQLGIYQTELQHIKSVAIHPSKNWVFAGGADMKIAGLNLDASPPETKHIPWKPERSISQVADLIFSPDGRMLFMRTAFDSYFVRGIPLNNSARLVFFVAHAMPGGKLRFGPDNTLIAARPGKFTVWDLTTGDIGKQLLSPILSDTSQIHPAQLSILFRSYGENNKEGKIKLWSHKSGDVELLSTGTPFIHPTTGELTLNTYDQVGFSPDGQYMHFLGNHLQFVYGIKEKRTVFKKQEKRKDGGGLSGQIRYAYSPDNHHFVFVNEQNELVAFDLKQGNELWRSPLEFTPSAIYYSSDGRHIALFNNSFVQNSYNPPVALDAGSGGIVEATTSALNTLRSSTHLFLPVLKGHYVNYIAASKWLGDVQFFDLGQAKTVRRLNLGTNSPVHAIEAPTGEIYIASSSGQLAIVEPEKDTSDTFIDLGVSPVQFVLSHDRKYLAILAEDGSILMVNTGTGKPVASLVEFLDGKWAVVAPDGRFDAKDPGETPGLSWVLADEPYTPRPIEIFYKEYYEPRLLPRLLAGEIFPEITPPTDVSRIQPLIAITKAESSKAKQNEITVTLEVGNVRKNTEKEGEVIAEDSGVFDVKLFRNGQLVATAPRDGGEVTLDPVTGKATIVIDSIRLPSAKTGGPVKFTAYAFNRHGIKSETSRLEYKSDRLPEERKRRAFIISIGVNKHDNPAWDLQYAANDALALNKTIAEGLAQQHEFDEVIPIVLTSDYPGGGNNNNATKRAVEAVVKTLAGPEMSFDGLEDIQGLEKLRRATPDDLLLISFSGHGYADQHGNFHLLPSDISKDSGRKISAELLRSTITSDDLYEWLRDVDAGEMIMVIDACNSAASVEGKGFKPGPMGSRGLGQLAYDKGMQILTASQAEMVALESEQLKHGALTYALVREGIDSAKADLRPKDAKITTSEWLRYGVERVPALYAEIIAGDFKPLGKGEVIIFMDGEEDEPQQLNVQRPGLFDFRKTQWDSVLKEEKKEPAAAR